jgi:hypothetical protein
LPWTKTQNEIAKFDLGREIFALIVLTFPFPVQALPMAAWIIWLLMHVAYGNVQCFNTEKQQKIFGR